MISRAKRGLRFAVTTACASVLLLAALAYGADDTVAGPGAQTATAKPSSTTKPSTTATSATAKPSSTVYRDVYNGWKWWHVYCYRCHGVNAIGGVNAPNLIGQNQKYSRPEFVKIARDGRPDKGMQSWKELLTDMQIGQIYLYVRARKEKVLPAGRPDELGPNHSPWAPPTGWPN